MRIRRRLWEEPPSWLASERCVEPTPRDAVPRSTQSVPRGVHHAGGPADAEQRNRRFRAKSSESLRHIRPGPTLAERKFMIPTERPDRFNRSPCGLVNSKTFSCFLGIESGKPRFTFALLDEAGESRAAYYCAKLGITLK